MLYFIVVFLYMSRGIASNLQRGQIIIIIIKNIQIIVA